MQYTYICRPWVAYLNRATIGYDWSVPSLGYADNLIMDDFGDLVER